MLLLSITKSMCLHGLEGIVIDVEVDISNGIPCWEIVGLPDTSIKESKERVKTAIRNCGIEISSRKYIINLSPANVRKEGAILDLAIAVGVLKSMNIVKNSMYDSTIFIGELSLNGDINRVNGILSICIEAVSKKIKRIILPKANIEEASIVKGIEVVGVNNLIEVIDYLNGKKIITNSKSSFGRDDMIDYNLDFSEVKGQKYAKRALEVSAAGNHNCILIGSPGSGKTMMAKRIPTILPDLSFEESLEITKIYSIAGKLSNNRIVTQRPFRNPHYSITEKTLLGGGRNPLPGEVSLAHLGVLFLDELLEYKSNTLDLLRIPMEDREINISRVGINVKYPCNFMVVASTNPCPCGYYGSKIKKCSCTELQRKKYISKLSGPLIDRFDIYLHVFPVNYKDIQVLEENSKSIRERVNRARKIQLNRYKNEKIYSNSELTPKLIDKYCKLDDKSKQIIEKSFKSLNLSMRGYSKVLKVARTIADLENKTNIEYRDVLESLQYRKYN